MTDILNYLHIRMSGMDFLRLIGAGIAAAFAGMAGTAGDRDRLAQGTGRVLEAR